LLLAAAQGCGGGPDYLKSDWELARDKREWRESAVALPAAPRPADLLPFRVSASTEFDFAIDAASIAVGEDGVVRYTLVARSPGGVENVTFEGIRCATWEYRIYATALAGGAWSRVDAPWRGIQPLSVQRWHNALATEYFCPEGNPIHTAEEGRRALRAGGHPSRARTGP
jgi:hypothetical protein